MPISDDFPYVDVTLTRPKLRVETTKSLMDRFQARFALQCVGVLVGGFMLGVVAEWVVSPDFDAGNGVRVGAGSPTPWGPTDFAMETATVDRSLGKQGAYLGRWAHDEPDTFAGNLVGVMAATDIGDRNVWPEDLPPAP
jgi:hypothetical protein